MGGKADYGTTGPLTTGLWDHGLRTTDLGLRDYGTTGSRDHGTTGLRARRLQDYAGKVAALGIADRFAAIIFSDEAGREAWKPSAIPYEKVMAELHRRGNECVYVGDNPAKDFMAPMALGWRTVQIRRAGGEYATVKAPPAHQADAIIHSLDELEGLVN